VGTEAPETGKISCGKENFICNVANRTNAGGNLLGGGRRFKPGY